MEYSSHLLKKCKNELTEMEYLSRIKKEYKFEYKKRGRQRIVF